MIGHFMEHKMIKVYEFEETEPLPTYLYTINAGPYTIYYHERIDEKMPP